jgi:hypothetical protein
MPGHKDGITCNCCGSKFKRGKSSVWGCIRGSRRAHSAASAKHRSFFGGDDLRIAVVAQQADGRSQSSGVHSRHMQPFRSRRPHALACQIWHGHNRPCVARAVFEKGGTTVTDILSAGALLRVWQTRATTDGSSRLSHPVAQIRAAEAGFADLPFFRQAA